MTARTMRLYAANVKPKQISGTIPFTPRSGVPEKYRRPHSHERVQAVERIKRDWHVCDRDSCHASAAHCPKVQYRAPNW